MRLLFIGDIVGRPGREIVKRGVRVLAARYGADLVVANGENAGQTWSDPNRHDSSPLMTLKGQVQTRPNESTLVVQARALRKASDRTTVNADYDLIDKLGEGGMGFVYLARQTSINRVVALKMLKSDTSTNAEQRFKFLSEAVVTGDLDHPNIVPIYDLGSSQDGIRQPDEPGLPEQNVNLRFRDGSVNQTFPTDTEGFVPFDQVFPFFQRQVAEVDYTRFKPTGVTVTVDAGGDVSGGPYPGLLNPQVQTEDCTPGSNCLSRTETGPVLLEAYQGFAGMTSIYEWGKAPYAPGENGGISGIVFYASLCQ